MPAQGGVGAGFKPARAHRMRPRAPQADLVRFRESLVLALEEEQRAFARRLRVDDLTEIDGVITAVVALADRALDVSDGPVQERDAVAAHMPGGILELLDPFGGEAVGEVLLVFAQQVDGKHTGFLEAFVAVGLLVDADQHQRRIQGKGRKGIGGDPGGDSRLVLGSDDGHSGGEMPHDMPDLSRVHGARGNRPGNVLSITGAKLIDPAAIKGYRRPNGQLVTKRNTDRHVHYSKRCS